MYHSITFGNKNTWDDWHLIPASRPVFNPPQQKTNVIDIPGANGSLDLSTILTGYPLYQNRTGSLEFIVANGYTDWVDLYSEISNYLHGMTMNAFLEDDPTHYYTGIFTVNEWKSNNDGTWSNITIDYDLHPYKYERVITQLTYSIGTSFDLSGLAGRMPVCPEIIVNTSDNSGILLYYPRINSGDRAVITLSDGTHTRKEICITDAVSPLTFRSVAVDSASSGNVTGTVSMKFQRGYL